MSSSKGLEYLTSHPFVRQTVENKALGTIIGAAEGDCIGLYTEFLPRTEAIKCYPAKKFSLLDPITPFRGDGHRDKFELGTWTDDTDHSLLIILSYLHNKGSVLPNDFAVRLHSWVSQGLRCLDRLPLGLGQTVGKVVGDTEFPTSPKDVALKSWLNASNKPAPNGSLMRTHPLGVICVPLSLEETFRIAADMSIVTHVDPRCVLSCCICTALIRGILRGEILYEQDINSICERAYSWVVADPELSIPGRQLDSATTELLGSLLYPKEFQKHINSESWEALELDHHSKIGYVYKCLGSAIFALRLAMRESEIGHDTFEKIITDLVMQGGDADTNACVAGALLGAWVGYSRLPYNWTKGMNNCDWLLSKTKRLVRQVGISEEIMDVSEDPDTALDGGRGLLSQADQDKREYDMVHKVLLRSKERIEAEEAAKKKVARQGFGKWFNM